MSLKIVLCGFLSLLLPSLGVAREWSDSSGKFKVEAELISYGDGKVILKKANGQPVTVPLEKLSTEDRVFARTVYGEEQLCNFLVRLEETISEVRSQKTSLQRTSQWDQKIPALLDDFRDQPLTFCFLIENVKRATGGCEFTIVLDPPVRHAIGDWNNFSLESIDRITLDVSEKDAVTISQGARLIINGICRPKLTHVTYSGGNSILAMMQDMADYPSSRQRTTTTDWVAYLKNLGGTDSDVAFCLSGATWRIDNSPRELPKAELTKGPDIETMVPELPASVTGREPGRTKWHCSTYGGTIIHVEGSEWDQVGTDGKIQIFTEVDRSAEYVEMTGFVFGRGRIYSDRIDMYKDGKWQWAAHGKWVE